MTGFRRYMCDDRDMSRPATGKTPARNIRVDGELWKAALAKAHTEDRSLTEVIVTYLRRYVSAPPRKRQAAERASSSPNTR
jgi:hypothetical protein